MNAKMGIFEHVQMLDQTLAFIRGARREFESVKEVLHPDDKKGHQRIDNLLKSLNLRFAIWDREIANLIALSKNPSE